MAKPVEFNGFTLTPEEMRKLSTPEEFSDTIKRTWNLGNKCSSARIMEGEMFNVQKDWNICFPGIENKTEGQPTCKVRLYYAKEAFFHGYHYPGLGIDFAKSEMAMGRVSF